MKHTLPELTYSHQDLEPHIDATTMEIHHTKHHQAYIDKLNAVLEKHPDIAEKSLIEVMKSFDSLTIPEADKTAIKNHGGGHLNHSFFWKLMDPKNSPDEKLTQRIIETFGSVDAMKESFNASALGQFGSGWAWLVEKESGDLAIYSTPNQDSPYLNGDTPIIGLDVWEHAYYLKYQNRRPEYITQWWNTVRIVA